MTEWDGPAEQERARTIALQLELPLSEEDLADILASARLLSVERCMPLAEAWHACLQAALMLKDWGRAQRLPPCACACHTYQGTYPTSKARPCFVCGHYTGQPGIDIRS